LTELSILSYTIDIIDSGKSFYIRLANNHCYDHVIVNASVGDFIKRISNYSFSLIAKGLFKTDLNRNNRKLYEMDKTILKFTQLL